MGLFKNILKRLGVDKTIAYSSGSKIVSAVSGLLTIVFISTYLSDIEQGFYYTFGSIIAMQVFFELGLTNILTQFVAHENAHLKWVENKITEENSINRSRLGHLLQFTKKWYLIISVLFLISILIGGIIFFIKYSPKCDYQLWLGPWLLVTTATAVHLYLTPFLAILDGVGKIKETSKIKFFQHIMVPVATWTAFIFDGGLYVVGIGQWCSATLVIIYILRSELWEIIKEINTIKITHKVNYLNEIFPYQWKIALSWASGYFVFQLFNPVLFATSGPVVAGQMGMSLTAINGIAAFATSWISTKIPKLSSLIALKYYKELDRLFITTMRQLSLICGLILLVLYLFITLLNYFNLNLAQRFLPLLPFALLELAIFANHLGNGWAIYLRCHKKEPLLINSIVGAITCGLSTIFLGKYYGVIGMASGYCILRVILTGWNYLVYIRKKRAWHLSK